jgi:hypothetical protein
MTQALSEVDDFVAKTARGMNRRRLFRNAGATALGTSLTLAYFGANPTKSQACSYSTVCGPSPLCPDTRCSGYSCHESSVSSWRCYNTASCCGSGSTNCWTTCSPGHQIWRCCDCCMRDVGDCGAACYGCGSGDWRRCICHGVIGSC